MGAKAELAFRDEGEGLTDKQKEHVKDVFEGVAEGKSFAQIAREIGVNRETIYNWRNDPNFWNAWHELFDEELELLLPKVLEVIREKLDPEEHYSESVARMVMTALGKHENVSEGSGNFVVVQVNNEQVENGADKETIVEVDGADAS